MGTENKPRSAGRPRRPLPVHDRKLAWALPIVHTVGRAFVRQLPKILLLLALMGQAVLLLTAAYLVDLSVSLMELWAELARKHLELTV